MRYDVQNWFDLRGSPIELIGITCHREITRVIATHRCSTGTRIDQCTDYRISYSGNSYVMFTYHCYTCMSWLHITVTYACHVFTSLLHLPYMFHVTVFMLYACFPLLILLPPLLDTWAVDMRYMDSHIYCFPFPVIVFRTINRAHVMLLYYMYHILYLFLIYCIMKDNNDNVGMGETWRLIRSYRVDVWIHCLSHCRGRGSAGYRLLLMSIPLLF